VLCLVGIVNQRPIGCAKAPDTSH